VSTESVASSETLAIVISNPGPDLRVTVADNLTRRPVTAYELPQGGHVTVPVGGSTHGWYDVTITSSADPLFVRQPAGHVETGRVSITDPALGS
jgi:phospholipase C